MNPTDTVLSTAAGMGPIKSNPAVELPQTARSMEVADFERLLGEAQRQQASVEFAPATIGRVDANLQSAGRTINSTSDEYVRAANDAMDITRNGDPTDMRTHFRAVESLTRFAIKNAEMQVLTSEISSAKKALTELFHNQG